MENKSAAIISEVGKAFKGKDDVITKVLLGILAGGHILLEDVPGVGKTTLALSFRKVLGLDYRRIQFTPDVTPSDVTGFTMFDSRENEFVFKPGAIMSNLILADEINRTSSKTQSALLEVMEEHQVTVDGTAYPMPEPFTVIGTENPIGSAGTQLLPASQLDRFLLKITIGYPGKEDLVAIMKDRKTAQPLDQLKQIVSGEELLAMQKEAQQVKISDEILLYIAELCEASQQNEYLELGISPRGSLALSRAARAKAYIEGRDCVLPEDVMAVFTDVCGHRVVLKNRARMSGISSDKILNDIIGAAATPLAKGAFGHAAS